MKCLNCGKEFGIERSIFNLFDTKDYYICDKCLKEHPIEINYQTIPIKNHTLDIISLLKKNDYVNIKAYLDLYNSIYDEMKTKYPNKLIVKYHFFDLKLHYILHYYYDH